MSSELESARCETITSGLSVVQVRWAVGWLPQCPSRSHKSRPLALASSLSFDRPPDAAQYGKALGECSRGTSAAQVRPGHEHPEQNHDGCSARELEAKPRAFPRLGEYSNHDVGSESGKGKTTPLWHLQHSKHFGCRCLVFLVLAPACAAVPVAG
jgi:hypothetical protein